MYGGKADSLLRLKSNGFKVPEFFMIDINDYKQFLEDNNLMEKIERYLKDGKRELISLAIINGKINEKLKSKIKEEFKKLNSKFGTIKV